MFKHLSELKMKENLSLKKILLANVILIHVYTP